MLGSSLRDSSLPGIVSCPAIAFLVTVVVVRLLWFHKPGEQNKAERQFTYTLLFALCAVLLREGSVQTMLSDLTSGFLNAVLCWQLGTTFIVMAFAPLTILAVSWGMGGRIPRWLPIGMYSSTFAAVPVMLVLGSAARRAHQPIDIARGWEMTAFFAIFAVFCAGMGSVLASICARELWRGKLPRKHVLTYIALGFVGMFAIEEGVSVLVSGILATNGIGTAFVDFRLNANRSTFMVFAQIGAVIGAIRIVTTMMRRLGWDRPARTIPRLTPMWSDLMHACPEIPRVMSAADPEAATSRRRLHRMSVEIRDALLVLNRFADPLDPEDLRRDSRLTATVQVARAADAKKSGRMPSGQVVLEAVRSVASMDEVRELVALADRWQEATAVAASSRWPDLTSSLALLENP